VKPSSTLIGEIVQRSISMKKLNNQIMHLERQPQLTELGQADLDQKRRFYGLHAVRIEELIKEINNRIALDVLGRHTVD